VRQVALDEPRTTQVPLDEPLPLSHAITLGSPADVATPKALRPSDVPSLRTMISVSGKT
jgi:hypothetical protein